MDTRQRLYNNGIHIAADRQCYNDRKGGEYHVLKEDKPVYFAFLISQYLKSSQLAIPFINIDGGYRVDGTKRKNDGTNDKHDEDKTILLQNILCGFFQILLVRDGIYLIVLFEKLADVRKVCGAAGFH
ncbi:hypothetical protein D3C77_490050 [compost metagenome]